MKQTAAEWAANREARKLPHYGGNRIPASYLARFGGRVARQDDHPDDLPEAIDSFLRDQL